VKADTKAIQAIHEHVITHNHRVTVSHPDLNTWNLHIKAVNEDDRGGYMCQLNTDPMKSQVIIIIVNNNVCITKHKNDMEHDDVLWLIKLNMQIIIDVVLWICLESHSSRFMSVGFCN
jgi:hypothetical protein